ncbi:unnamed protein product (macronuclear) [Paramecium tetraurelia]|uniref:Uncharacterized protein n=1 Tax=Paramecium tetraurelia TaxID=5888 RepID=A0C3P3_PARTE|nr:uncharacterized protein GSPATT00034889001 [Paramecium tetraurelia]CAK65410.1 unnamed protein product [Paramecium tetraurelia]|eukprot:XP_001432807.1 hypothetical protein (macronuclear) [Paramecium tetraurelia strain d4-2]
MKLRLQNENCQSKIYTHRSERSSCFDILQDLTNNKQQLLNQKAILENRTTKQDLILNEHNIQLQQSKVYKTTKIQQLKIQLQTLKQNYDKQAISQSNLSKTIDNTVKYLLELKTNIYDNQVEEPWQEIIKIEKVLYGNEDNIIQSMPIQNFNEVISGHQLSILEMVSQWQNQQQQNYWIAQMKLLHETFIQKNLSIGQILKPRQVQEQSAARLQRQDFQSFSKKC